MVALVQRRNGGDWAEHLDQQLAELTVKIQKKVDVKMNSDVQQHIKVMNVDDMAEVSKIAEVLSAEAKRGRCKCFPSATSCSPAIGLWGHHGVRGSQPPQSRRGQPNLGTHP